MPKCVSLILVVTFLLGATPHVRSQSVANASFGQAYAHYSRKEYSAANALLRSALEAKGSVLRDYSLYYLGRVAIARRESAKARQWFRQLEREFPHSRWTSDSSFQLVRIDLEQEHYDRAIERAQSLRKRNKGREAGARASYYLGQAYEGLGQNHKAFREYQGIRPKAPRSKWNARGKKRITRLLKLDPTLGANTAKDLLKEAQQLLRERDYPAAEQAYLRVLAETNFRRLSLRGLSKVYRRTRQRLKEAAILRQVIQHYTGTADAGAALGRIATIEWNRDENESALRTFRTLKAHYPNHPQVAFATYAIGRIHESHGDWKAALGVYRDFPKRYPHSRFRADAAWRRAWIYYLNGDKSAAHGAFRRIAGRPGNFNVAATFWQAQTAAALGKKAEAQKLHLRLAHDSKNPYYRSLARERLAEPAKSTLDPGVPGNTKGVGTPIRINPRASFHLARARALAELSLNRFARLELNRVKALSQGTPDLKRFLMREYAAVQAFNESVALAHQLPTSDETIRHRFPLSYWKLIRRHARENGVDPFLVVALIRQESLFNPGAVSPAAALGLMQLLHKTARNEAASLGLPAPQRNRLFDPELNIKLGTHHLKRLLTRYADSHVKALAAYNAGGKPVERWSKDFVSATDSEFTERIPYKETRLYVKKVLRNYWVYKQLYGTDQPQDQTSQRLKDPGT